MPRPKEINQLAGNTIYSNSRLSCFEDCPKRFWYRYVIKIPSEFESIEAFVGKRVHEVIERLHLALAKGHIPTLDQVLRRFALEWQEHYAADKINIVRSGMKESDYQRYGERCLRNFYARHYPFDGDETLAVEKRLVFTLDQSGQYRVQGILDRLVRCSDGSIEIHDYKTSRRTPSQAKLDRDRQLALYQIGVKKHYGENAEIRLVWHYLASDHVRHSTRSPDELDALALELMGIIDQIQATRHADEFEARPTALCNWCEFQHRCPAKTGRPDEDLPSPQTSGEEDQLALF